MEKFQYLDVAQRSPDWFKVRMGRVTASRLSDWLAVSKTKPKEGEKPAPLKARLDYERELWFERRFGVSFNNYVSEAMLDGQDFEDFARQQYEIIRDVKVNQCGCWYNDFFVASPDGIFPIVAGSSGLAILETKILRDNVFTEVLLTGVPENHYKQIQGQLWATKAEYCDYVAINLNTRKIAIWRVTPNAEFFAMLEKSVQEPLSVEDVATDEVYPIRGELPSRDMVGVQSVTVTKTESWL